MKFKASHARAVTGNNIEVEVECDGDEEIIHVKVELDGFPLADDDLESPAEEYDNQFLNKGDAGPLMDHKLVVTATTGDDKTHSSTTVWTDPV
jgi:hypothetical protein